MSVLDQALKSDSTRNIIVNFLTPSESVQKSIVAGSATRALCPFNSTSALSSGWVTAGNRRGMTTLIFSKIYVNPYPYKKVIVTNNINVQSQKKVFPNKWVYPCPNQCSINGTWTFKLRIINNINLNFLYDDSSTPSYAYPSVNCTNNFWASINPKTGISSPYPSTFLFARSLAYEAINDAYMTNLNWTISVPGGFSGISCGVSCN
jgi:hypothetical protein